MPELKNRPPHYRRHKASGQAMVTIGGRDYYLYLGPYGSPVGRANYEQLIAEWQATLNKPRWPEQGTVVVPHDLRICELLKKYLEFAKLYYVKNGKQTGEYVNLKHAVEPQIQLFNESRVSDFRPRDLKAVRQVKNGSGDVSERDSPWR